MATAATLLRAFDAATLQEWYERDQRRKDLEREARQLAAENAVMAKDLQAALIAAGRTEIARGEYRAGLVDGRATVAWKEEFIRVAGAERRG